VDPQQREKLEEQISAYLDGELSEKEAAELERLLADSGEARQVLGEFERTVSLVRGLPRQQPPDDLYEAVTSQLERAALLEPTDAGAPARSALDRWGRLRRFASVAAVLVAAVGIGYLTITGNGKGQRGPAKQEAELQLAEADRSEEVGRQMQVAAAPADRSEADAASDRPVRARGIALEQSVSKEVEALAAAPPETATPQVQLPSKAPPPPARQPVPKPVSGVVERVASALQSARRPAASAVERGTKTADAAKLSEAIGDRVVPLPTQAQQVTMLVTAQRGKPVWQASLELSQALAEEGVTLLPVASSDRGAGGRAQLYYGAGYEVKADQPGLPLYRFRASPEQVARLSNRVASVRGVQVDVQGTGGETSDFAADTEAEESVLGRQGGGAPAGQQARQTVELSKGVPARSADVEGVALGMPLDADSNVPTEADEAAPRRAGGQHLKRRFAAGTFETGTATTQPAPVAHRELTRGQDVAGVPVEMAEKLGAADTQPSQVAAEVEVTVLIRSLGQQRER